MANVPALPEGFVLEEPASGWSPKGAKKNTPALPEGFVLEGAEGPSANDRYESALSTIRQKYHPNMPEDKWQEYSKGPLGKYNPNDLAQHSALFGFTDEISAGVASLGPGINKLLSGKGLDGFGEGYSDYKALEEARRDAGREKWGPVGLAAEVGGGLTSLPRAMYGPSALAANTVGTLLKGGAQAAGGGALYGFGDTDGGWGDRAKGAVVGGLVGGGAGLLLPIAGAALARGKKGKLPDGAVAAAPTADEIRALSRASYNAADTSGVSVKPAATAVLKHDFGQLLSKEGIIDPTGKVVGNYSKVKKALKHLDSFEGRPMTMTELQRFEESLQDIAASKKGGEAFVGQKMLELFDDYVEALPQGAFNGANGPAAAASWKAGKQSWALHKRTKTIEKAIYDAQLSDDFVGALRSNFRSILTNDKKRRGFSPAEIQAIEAFLEGGPSFRLLQAFRKGGGLPGAFVGSVAGGPVGMFGVPLAGAVAGKALNSGAQKAAQGIRARVASPGLGSTLNVQPLNVPALSRLGAAVENPLLEKPRSHFERLLFGN